MLLILRSLIDHRCVCTTLLTLYTRVWGEKEEGLEHGRCCYAARGSWFVVRDSSSSWLWWLSSMCLRCVSSMCVFDVCLRYVSSMCVSSSIRAFRARLISRRSLAWFKRYKRISCQERDKVISMTVQSTYLLRGITSHKLWISWPTGFSKLSSSKGRRFWIHTAFTIAEEDMPFQGTCLNNVSATITPKLYTSTLPVTSSSSCLVSVKPIHVNTLIQLTLSGV